MTDDTRIRTLAECTGCELGYPPSWMHASDDGRLWCEACWIAREKE